MPCYLVQTVSVVFKVENVDLLIQALRELDYVGQRNGDTLYVGAFTFDLVKGTVDYRDRAGYADKLNAIKRGYSYAAIDAVAKKRKWIHKQTAENKGTLRRY